MFENRPSIAKVVLVGLERRPFVVGNPAIDRAAHLQRPELRGRILEDAGCDQRHADQYVQYSKPRERGQDRRCVADNATGDR